MSNDKLLELAKKGGITVLILWLLYNSVLPLLNDHGQDIKMLQVDVNKLTDRLEKAESQNKKLGMLLLELNKDNPELTVYLIKIFGSK